MSEFFGSDFLGANMANDSAIVAIVGTSIYSARLIPQTDTTYKTINYYLIGNFDGGLEYFNILWSIDCRSDNENESRQLAYLVFSLFNRYGATEGSYEYFAVCEILPTIPKLNDADVYNTPVQVTLRRR